MRDINIPVVPLHIGSSGIIISSFSAGGEALLVSTALTAGGILVWRVLDGGGLPAVRDTTGGKFAVTYVPFMAGFLVVMLSGPNWPRRVTGFRFLAGGHDFRRSGAGFRFRPHRA